MPLAMPMQLNLPFDHATNDHFSRFSILFTEHEIHVAHGFFRLLYVTALCWPLAPVYRYHILYWKYSVLGVFVSVLFFAMLSSRTLSFMLFSMNVYIKLIHEATTVFLIKLIIFNRYINESRL